MGKLNIEGTYFDKVSNQWKPMVGSRWGRLTVIKYEGRKSHGLTGSQGWYECLCDCGKTVYRKHACLTQKQTVSCGCWKAEKCGLRFQKTDTAFRDLWSSYKKGARERRLEWSLTEEQFRTLTSSPCYYTGREPNQEARSCQTRKRDKRGLSPFSGGVYLYNGIDRLDSSKGYTLENCVPACGAANKAKLELSHDEFIALCKEIADRH
jgi:hypothetical protein